MNARIKLSARAALTGSQTKIIPTLILIILLFFFFSVCNAVLNYIPVSLGEYLPVIFPSVSLLTALAAIAPLMLRLEIKHLLLARGINPHQRLNLGLSGVLKACEMYVCLFFIKLFWLVFFELIPIAATLIFLKYNSDNAVSLRASAVFFSGMAILSVAGLIFYLIYTQRYSKSMFYLACYKDFTVIEAIGESTKRTKGKNAEIFFFKASFLPWFILCTGIFPMLYVIPYYKQSVTCYFLSR